MIVEVLIASALGAVGTVVAAYVWENKIRDKVYVRRILSPTDPDIVGMLELYLSLFPDDGINYTGEDLMEFVAGQGEFSAGRHVKVENFVLVARFKTEVVGLLFCHFYPERKKAIVSYYGINKQIVDARRSAASQLLKKIHSFLQKKDCAHIFFDALRPGKELSKDENNERKARLTLLKQSAKALGLHAYEMQFDYKSPRITLAEGTHEEPLRLMVVPLQFKPVTHFTKVEVLEFVRFVYQDCYGDIYRTDDPHFPPYQTYLSERVKTYEEVLPEQVAVI